MKNKKFVKVECENCGASLSLTDRRGEYRCKFCGSLFMNDEEKLNDRWIKTPPLEPEPEPLNFEPPVFIQDTSPITDIPSSSFSVKKGNKTAIAITLSLISICLTIAVCSGLSNISSSSVGVFSESVEPTDQEATPVMLSSLPTNPVLAGQAVAYQGWELLLDHGISTQRNLITISLSLTNWTGADANFRYIPNDIKLMDDVGNEYPISTDSCDADLLFFQKEISVDARNTTEIESSSSWCRHDGALPIFSGTIASNASKLYVVFSNFGPFTNLICEVDL